MFCKPSRGVRTCKAIPVMSLSLPWTWTRKSTVSLVPEQTKRKMGSHRQVKDTEVWRSFTSNILLCWTLLERRCQVQEGEADRSLSEYDSNCNNQYSQCFGMQSGVSLSRSVCLVWSGTIFKSSWWPRTIDRRPHEPGTLKRSNSFGNRMGDSEDSKTIAQVSQEAGSSGEVGKAQHFVTRLSTKNSVGWTLVCRECTHYLTVIHMHSWYVILKIMCALVLLAGLHSKEVTFGTESPKRKGLFQDADFAGNLTDSKSTSGGVWCIFGSQTHVPIHGHARNNQLFSHSSTQSRSYLIRSWSANGWITALNGTQSLTC